MRHNAHIMSNASRIQDILASRLCENLKKVGTHPHYLVSALTQQRRLMKVMSRDMLAKKPYSILEN